MNKIENFKKIMKKSETNRVLLLTNHYQIIGDVYECSDCNKENCVNLTNVKLCNVEDVFGCECEYESNYDWLHINLDKVVAFSFLK
ncbi:MAG: hypothetical protein E7Z92_03925 [Cyanobacteria bacterium SIG31]|nr:hypothetical protein [Cyanobacteria bacterium SIG31]